MAWKQPCLYIHLLLLALHVMTAWQAAVQDGRISEVMFEALSSRAAAFSKQFDKLGTDYILHMEADTYRSFSLRFE